MSDRPRLALGAPATAESRIEPETVFPARTAVRITAVLSLGFMGVVSVTRSIEHSTVFGFLWLTVLLNVLMGYHPRVSEQARARYIAGTWLLVALASLAESGLRGGPATFLVALGLFGLFFGRRQALAVLALGVVCMGVAGLAELRGWWAPRFGTPGNIAEEWVLHGLFFALIATMLTLTLTATLTRATLAGRRARQFALAAEHADRAMFVLDAAGAVTWVNAAFALTMGISQREAIGRTLSALLGDSPRAAAALADLGTTADGSATGPARVECVLLRRGADALWVSLELRPLGDAPGTSGLLLDVTEARAAAELDRVQQALATALSSAGSAHAACAALTAALTHAAAVRGVRIVRRGESDDSATVYASAGDHEAPDVPRAPGEGEGPPRSCARFPIGGDAPGALEVLFDAGIPGRAALTQRIPELVAQLERHEHRLAEQARFEALFELSPDALVLIDRRGRVARRNALAGRFGPTLDGDPGEGWPAALAAAVAAAAERGEATRGVAWAAPDADADRDLEATVAPIALPEGRGVLVSVRDVTARRAAERARELALEEVRAALAEREVLLKEIHHRVKNNLQIVSSLLSMQHGREVSAETRTALEESAHRVRSMALIHQKLYAGDDLARVELAGYARSLASELCAALGRAATLSFDTEPTELNVEQAVPCGLILNELVVNALKHGCDGRGRCAVRIAVGRAGELVRVAVSDDGPGLPAGFDVARLRESATLGMRLIAALTRQIGATLQVAPGPGARFVVLVPSTPARGPRRGPRSSLPPPVTTAAG